MPPYEPRPWTAALGKAAAPQRQEHEHAPLSTCPVPLTIDGLLAAGGATATGAGAAAEAAGGAALAAGCPPAMTAVAPAPFWATAICWNIAWVLLTDGLMEKVIPFPQWLA